MTLTAGQEPPAIWKVQKALLQKFVPELRDRKRVFSATNSVGTGIHMIRHTHLCMHIHTLLMTTHSQMMICVCVYKSP